VPMAKGDSMETGFVNMCDMCEMSTEIVRDVIEDDFWRNEFLMDMKNACYMIDEKKFMVGKVGNATYHITLAFKFFTE
jgi:hypothetical protein